MFAATQGLFSLGEELYFSGWSYGYYTQVQELVKDATSPDYDSFVYKYDFSKQTYK